jgi:AcrR family transcriptional regulator
VTPPRQQQQGGPAAVDDSERTRLTRAAVVDRALALADASGLEGLTIRKLATELGVTPMALYWHFRGKDELLNGLADRIWSEIDIEVDPGAPWIEQIRGMLVSLLSVLRAHPAAPQLLLRAEKLAAPASLNVTEAALEVLRSAGFSAEDATAIARTALWTGIMLVMSEPGVELGDGPDRAELLRKKTLELATLSPARYPRLVEAAVPMTACDDPELHYQFGVEFFMAGAQAIAACRAGHE